MAPKLSNLLPDIDDEDAVMAFMTGGKSPKPASKPVSKTKWFGIPSDEEDEEDAEDIEVEREPARVFGVELDESYSDGSEDGDEGDKRIDKPVSPQTPTPPAAKDAAAAPAAIAGPSSPTPMQMIMGQFPTFKNEAQNNHIIKHALAWIQSAKHQALPNFRNHVKLVRSNIVSQISYQHNPPRCDMGLLKELEDTISAALQKSGKKPAEEVSKPAVDPMVQYLQKILANNKDLSDKVAAHVAAEVERNSPPKKLPTPEVDSESSKSPESSPNALKKRKAAFFKERRLERKARKSASPPLAMANVIRGLEAKFSGKPSPPRTGGVAKRASVSSGVIVKSIEVDEPLPIANAGSQDRPIEIEDDLSDGPDEGSEDDGDVFMSGGTGPAVNRADAATPSADRPSLRNLFSKLNHIRSNLVPLTPGDDFNKWQQDRVSEQLLGELQQYFDRDAAENASKDDSEVDTPVAKGKESQSVKPASANKSTSPVPESPKTEPERELLEFHGLVDYLSTYIYVQGFLNVLVEHFRKVRKPTSLFGQAVLSWCGADKTTYQIFGVDLNDSQYKAELNNRHNPTVLFRHPFQRIRLIGVYNRLLKKSLGQDFEPSPRGNTPKPLDMTEEISYLSHVIETPSNVLEGLLDSMTNRVAYFTEINTPNVEFNFFDNALNRCQSFRKQYKLGGRSLQLVEKLPRLRALVNQARITYREISRKSDGNARGLAAVDRALERVEYLAHKYRSEPETLYGRGKIPRSKIFCGNLNCQRHFIAGDRISPNAPPPETCGICDPMTLLMAEDSRVVPQGGEIWRADAVNAFSYGTTRAQRMAISRQMMLDLENSKFGHAERPHDTRILTSAPASHGNRRTPSPEPGFLARVFGRVAAVQVVQTPTNVASSKLWEPSTWRYETTEELFEEVCRAELRQKHNELLKQPAQRVRLFGASTAASSSRALSNIEKDVVKERGNARPKKLTERLYRIEKLDSDGRPRKGKDKKSPRKSRTPPARRNTA